MMSLDFSSLDNKKNIGQRIKELGFLVIQISGTAILVFGTYLYIVTYISTFSTLVRILYQKKKKTLVRIYVYIQILINRSFRILLELFVDTPNIKDIASRSNN